MALNKHRALVGRCQLFRGIVTQSLEHAVPRRRAGLDDNHGTLDQSANDVEHLTGRHRWVADDRFGSGQPPPALEDRQPVEDLLVVLAEQRVAPLDGGLQCLLPGLCCPGSGGEERESLSQPVRNLGERHRCCPRRGKLQGEWHAIEGATDFRNGHQVLLGKGVLRSHGVGALHEELCGGVVQNTVCLGLLRGCLQGPDRDLRLVGNRQRLSTCRQDGDTWTPTENGVDEASGRIHHVFAVVDEQEHASSRQVGNNPLPDVAVCSGSIQGDPERVCHGEWHLTRRVH